jgi:RTX calcium-binding nonapeptide repeat (4 copies)/Protein of unknown function (DUF2974)
MTSTVTSVVASPATGDEGIGQLITITLAMSANVTVSGGTPKLILNDGGVAVYDASKSTPTSMVFDYIIAGGQSTSGLAVTDALLNGASVVDNTGAPADLSSAITTFSTLQVYAGVIGLSYNSQSHTEYVTSVDPTTGAVTTIGPGLSGVQLITQGVEAVEGNNLYFIGETGTPNSAGVVLNPGPPTLFTADISTGLLTNAVPVSANFEFNYVSAAGQLIGLSYNSQTQTEYVTSVDPTTGAVTTIGPGLSGVQLITQGAEAVEGNDLYFIGETGTPNSAGVVLNPGPPTLFTADITTGLLTNAVPVPGNFEFGPQAPILFTTGAEAVDFNDLTTAQEVAIADGADVYDGLGGSDVVTLPNEANYDESVGSGQTLGWVQGTTFDTGDSAGQNYTITGGDGNDTIQLGNGNDVVYGSPGNDTITAGTGQDTFDYQAPYPPGTNAGFANFDGFAPGTVQTITGGHSTFATTSSQQNVLLLPGSPNDYTISVKFKNGDSLADTVSTLTTTGADGLPQGISINATDVEDVSFANQINNQVHLRGGTVASEMIQLAQDVYGPVPTLSHSAEALAYSTGDSPVLFLWPYASNTLGQSTVTAAAIKAGWLPVSAMQLGMAPADFGQTGTIQYSFENGFYAAINTADHLGGDYSEADAMVLQGIVDNKNTLAIAIRGTDQYADFTDYADFETYYNKLLPLVNAIQAYLESSAGKNIQQVLISGHSLGAAAVQYLLNDLQSTSESYSIQAYTDGSPGSDNTTIATGAQPLNNFVQIGDPIAVVPSLAGSNQSLLVSAITTLYGAAVSGPFLPKSRSGTDIFIDDNGPLLDTSSLTTLVSQLRSVGGTTYHSASLYDYNVATLASFASDPDSPFEYSQVGQSLLNNTIYYDNSVYSNPFAIGGVDGNEIAVNSLQNPRAPNPTPGRFVYVHPADDYVLGGDGYTINWDLPTSGELVHVVDGGPDGNSTVDFLGASNDYAFVPTSTAIGTDLQVYYFPNGEPLFASPTSGQLIGDLYRIPLSDISFFGAYVTSVSATQVGNIEAGQTVQVTLTLSGGVTVDTSTGTPTLTLSDPVTATYDASASNPAGGTLVFDYTAVASDKFADLQITGVNLNGATVTGVGGADVDLSAALNVPLGVSVNSPLIVTAVSSSLTGNIGAGQTVQLTLTMSEALTLNSSGGAPSVTLNDGGTGLYDGAASNPSAGTLVFDYTVGATDTTPDLAVTSVNLPTGTAIQDANGYNADFSGALNAGTGIQVGSQVEPIVTAITATTDSGAIDLDAGHVVTITVATSEAVTVTGTPTLQLNDNEVATYQSGSGSRTLTFTYTVEPGDNITDLQVTGLNLPNGATIADGAGNALTGSVAQDLALQIDTTPPMVTAITATTDSGAIDLDAGHVVTITVATSEAVTVTGTPTLQLNDNEVATYQSGSGSKTLTFTYTVEPGDNITDLQVTGLNLPNGATIADGAGNALIGSVTQDLALQINAAAPTVTSIVASPNSGDKNTGNIITLTVAMSENVTVIGTPILTLNDGGTATYMSGSGSSVLTFTYTVGNAQNTSALAITGNNLNGSTIAIADVTGNQSDLSDADVTFPNLAIGATVQSVSANPSSGDLGPGKKIVFTVTMSEPVKVTGGKPLLSLNDGGTATYTSGSGTNVLTFTYTVGALGSGQNVSALAVTGFNLNGATVYDSGIAADTADLSRVVSFIGGPQIDTTAPTVLSVQTSGPGITNGNGDLDAGKTVTLIVNFSENVTVAAGTPTLRLNDGGTASYTSGSGTSTLTFVYTVATGQNTADLAVNALALNGATIKDGAGNNAVLSSAATNPPGTLQIDTKAPTITSIVTSGAGITNGKGDLDAGKTVVLTVNFNANVTVTGAPILTLNDGGNANYAGGSGTSALTFTYVVAEGQNTPDLTVTELTLNGGTIEDAAGNDAVLTGAMRNPARILQIDTTAPTVTQVLSSPASGEATTGHTVRITLDMSEKVSVSGSPILLLNDNGTASYDAAHSTPKALVFDYTAAEGQVTTDVQVSGIVLPASASIADLAGNNANMSGAGANLGLGINTPPGAAAGPSGGNFTISGSTDLDLFGGSNASVSFASGSIGTLTLSDSQAFAGTVAGLALGNYLDLADIAFGASTTLGYTPNANNTGGTLSVNAGSHTANIALLGNYLASSFVTASDGHGGMLITDPPPNQLAIIGQPLHA